MSALDQYPQVEQVDRDVAGQHRHQDSKARPAAVLNGRDHSNHLRQPGEDAHQQRGLQDADADDPAD